MHIGWNIWWIDLLPSACGKTKIEIISYLVKSCHSYKFQVLYSLGSRRSQQLYCQYFIGYHSILHYWWRENITVVSQISLNLFHTDSFQIDVRCNAFHMKVHLQMLYAKYRPFCLAPHKLMVRHIAGYTNPIKLESHPWILKRLHFKFLFGTYIDSVRLKYWPLSSIDYWYNVVSEAIWVLGNDSFFST